MQMEDYQAFLASKRLTIQPLGISVDPDAIHPSLFPFQRELVRWAVRKGRAALFCDTGLGKTRLQVEWARLLGRRTLIFAPLSVARQTVAEAAKIGVTVCYVRTPDEFTTHYGYIVRELLRVHKPGRLTCVHVAQIPAMLARDGYIGLKDFRGDVIRLYTEQGWIYHGEVCIDKDPQAQAIRTKSKGLLFVQMHKDSSWSRPALADYILVFRKPGENAVPINPDLTNDEWISWARPIWYGIRESDTLQYQTAREDADERHICPLQLGTIERCIRLWSNPGETVLTPFLGIGSEAYQAVKLGRKAVGIELKRSYWRAAVRNVAAAVAERDQPNFLSLFNQQVPA